MPTFTVAAKTYSEPAVLEHNRVIKRVPVTPYTFTKADHVGFTNADVVQINFFKLPVGAKLLSASLQTGTDLDSSTTATLTLKASDGTNTKTLLSAASGLPAAFIGTDDAATAPAIGVIGYVFNKDNVRVYAELTAPTAANIAASSDIHAMIEYTLDTESGERTA